MLSPGTKVTCEYRGSHVGVLLAIDDPRAWHGTIALGPKPTRRAVTVHVA